MMRLLAAGDAKYVPRGTDQWPYGNLEQVRSSSKPSKLLKLKGLPLSFAVLAPERKLVELITSFRRHVPDAYGPCVRCLFCGHRADPGSAFRTRGELTALIVR